MNEECINTRDMPAFEICVLVSGMPGSLREIGERIGRSRGYVSTLRKIARDASRELLEAWGKDDISFELVRLIANKGEREQLELVQGYLERAGDGRVERGAARAWVLAELGR
jgi:hypothetical protein